MDVNERLFAAEIKKQLHIKGWTYSDLAKETGYSLVSIKKLISGERHSAALVNSVTRALDMR